MRALSGNLSRIMDTDAPELLLLVRIEDAAGSLILGSTSHYDTITLSNGWSYASNGILLSLDPPQQTTVVTREQYKISLVDSDGGLRSYGESSLFGKKLDVRLSAMDPLTGLPLTTLSDLFVIYRGRINSVNSRIVSTEIGESTLNISGSSPVMSLEMKNGIFFSKEEMRQRSGNDSCADDLYEGSGATVLKWGKA
jgi:hypothetical protein